jgi:hypothetical protein
MYFVDWLQSALNELAILWMNADSPMRDAIVRATDDIDDALRKDPYQGSESRPGGMRIQFFHPLGVKFRIINERTAEIGHVWSIIRKRRQ